MGDVNAAIDRLLNQQSQLWDKEQKAVSLLNKTFFVVFMSSRNWHIHISQIRRPLTQITFISRLLLNVKLEIYRSAFILNIYI
jgi:hypothetical protein